VPQKSQVLRNTGSFVGDRVFQERIRMPLPPGLNPVEAGRLGLWLLSIRSHKAAQKRVAFPERAWRQTLAVKFTRLICQWHVYEYPGAAKILAALLRIPPSYAENLMKPSWSRKLPAKHAITLAQYLESHASQCEALAHELWAYAKARDGVLRPR